MNFLVKTLLVTAAFAGLSTAQVKLGVINSQKAVLETAEIKKAQNELETKFKPRQDKIVLLQKELERLHLDIKTLMAPDVLNKIGEHELRLRAKSMSLAQELRNRREQFTHFGGRGGGR